MTLSHYAQSTGPRGNSPTHSLTPCGVFASSGASGSPGDYRASVTLRWDDETATRVWRMQCTPEEAEEMGQALLKGAASARESLARLTEGAMGRNA